MTAITPEAVAEALAFELDGAQPVIAGRGCVIHRTEAMGVDLRFTVIADAQHHYVATIRDEEQEPGPDDEDRERDVDLVHNLLVNGVGDPHGNVVGVDGDVITLKAPGRVLRITVDRS